MSIRIPQTTDISESFEILPTEPLHRTLEEDTTSYLHRLGYLVHEMTYHSVLPQETVQLLQNRYSPTALYLRGRADRIAIHRSLSIEFEWEAKTHIDIRYADLTVEALPYIHHLIKCSLDVQCLYVFHIPHANIEGGFWVHDPPPIRTVWIPTNRWNISQRDWFKGIFKDFFPGKEPVEAPVGGTGDPFIIFDNADIKRCLHWKELIAGLSPRL